MEMIKNMSQETQFLLIFLVVLPIAMEVIPWHYRIWISIIGLFLFCK